MVDYIPFPFETSFDNLKRIAISQPFWVSDFTLLPMRKDERKDERPNEESRLRTAIRPFSALVCPKVPLKLQK